MKKITMLISTLLIGSFIYAQQAPAGTSNGSVNWRRGGNTAGGGSPNIFGTFWNSPIYTYTNGIARIFRRNETRFNGVFSTLQLI